MGVYNRDANADQVIQVDAAGNPTVLAGVGQKVALYDSAGNALITAAGGVDAVATAGLGLVVNSRNFGLNPAGTWDRQRVNALRDLMVQQRHAQMLSATAAAGSGVTLTIPTAGAGVFNYLIFLQIILYAAAALAGGATPILVTTTGLVGTPTFTFPSALAIGAIAEEKIEQGTPLSGTAAATAMTIVCPVVTNGIWRVNAAFFTA